MKAPGFRSFYGMDELVDRLRKGVDGDRFVHAYLFCGPSGTGKRTLAGICARALNCTGAGEKPCDACASCQKYLTGNHPDHIVVSEDKSIKVDAVRELVERISGTPYEGGRHTVIIEHADRMTPQAQNALLKTLEEPPANAVFFLLTERISALLPTIISRVRAVRFAPLAQDVVEEALVRKGLARARAAQLAAVAQGAVGRALALDADEDYWQMRERALGALTILSDRQDVSGAFACIKDDKASANAVLGVMEQAGLALMRARETALEPDPRLVPAGLRLEGDALIRGVWQARQMLESNVSWQSSVEMMFLDLTPKMRGV
ncbi:MAG: DNA polymerase III subunit delta' [Clostridia bacterium]